MMNPLFFILIILLTGCSGLEQAQTKELKVRNECKDKIHRHSTEKHYEEFVLERKIQETYPWD